MTAEEAKKKLAEVEATLQDIRIERQDLEKQKENCQKQIDETPMDLNLDADEMERKVSKLNEEQVDLIDRIAELEKREGPLLKRADEYKTVIWRFEETEKAKLHNQMTVDIYERMKRFNALVSDANNELDKIEQLIRTRPKVKTFVSMSGGGQKRVVNVLPDPYGTDRWFKKRFAQLDLSNESMFIEYKEVNNDRNQKS